MFDMFYVMYGRITFSSVFAITDRRDIGLYVFYVVLLYSEDDMLVMSGDVGC